ncbi:MAG: NnrS family protein [Chloroflexi bacterium]|nr:NnrS family protein [Chloroflexota bacterium]
MRPQLLAVPVAVLLMLLALAVGVLRLLTIGGMLDGGQPPLAQAFPFHGEIMVFGFLAVLIVTERYLGSLPFRLNRIVHLMPFLVAVGAVLKVVGRLAEVDALNAAGVALLGAGLVIYLYMLLELGRQSARTLPFRFMALAAFFLLAGAIFSLRGAPVGNMNFTLFLLGFPILTILGERVELSRFLSPATYRRAEGSLLAAGIAFLLLLVGDGDYLVAIWAGLLGLATLPLLASELALIRAGEASPERLHRYLGRHLVVAYLWFFLGLALAIAFAASQDSGALRDASSHSLAVGFVGTMILAHAPVIAPAIFPWWRIDAQRLSLVPLGLLTVGNLLRVALDILNISGTEKALGISGLLVAAAVVAFAWMMARSLKKA